MLTPATQCDLQRDVCGQCRRAKLSCGGFRDPNQLIIRDETSSTQRKYAHARHPPVLTLTDPRLAWEVQARHAFFSHYVFGISRSYDALAPLYSEASPNGYLAASVDAVSLAFVAYQDNAPDLLLRANEHYVTAIARLSSALTSPGRMKRDDTLQTALLLDLYEKLVNSHAQPSSSWMSHIKGAMALVEARGESNTATYVSRRLATRLVITLVISCAVANVRVPDELLDLREQLRPFLPQTDPKWIVSSLVVEVINLTADSSQGKISGMEAIALAEEMDRNFQEIEEALPPSWEFVRMPLTNRPNTPEEIHRDEYVDHFTTQIWNVIRTMRILLSGIIQKYDPSREEKQTAIKDAIALDICSSAPQFVWPQRSGKASAFTKAQCLECHTLLAPLYIAGQVCREKQVKAWILDTMRYMAEAGGMSKASVAADYLDNSPDVSYWSVYKSLGSYAFAS